MSLFFKKFEHQRDAHDAELMVEHAERPTGIDGRRAFVSGRRRVEVAPCSCQEVGAWNGIAAQVLGRRHRLEEAFLNEPVEREGGLGRIDVETRGELSGRDEPVPGDDAECSWQPSRTRVEKRVLKHRCGVESEAP